MTRPTRRSLNSEPLSFIVSFRRKYAAMATHGHAAGERASGLVIGTPRIRQGGLVHGAAGAQRSFRRRDCYSRLILRHATRSAPWRSVAPVRFLRALWSSGPQPVRRDLAPLTGARARYRRRYP